MSRLVASQRAWLAPSWVREDLSRKAQALPSLDLRFAESKSLTDAATGANLVTFTRASSGTYVGSDGLLKTATTNLLLRSEEFDNASWVKTGLTVTANSDVSPDGQTTADTLTIGGTGQSIYQSATVTASTSYTGSVYVKLGTLAGANYKVAVYDNTNAAFIATDVVPTQTPTSTGWTRISYTFTTPATCTSVRWYPFRNSGNLSGTAFVWGAQLEQSSTVGEYIPSTSTINSAPRFDHNPTTGESLGLLVEEARTNLLLYSACDSNWVTGGFGTATYNLGLSALGAFSGVQIASAGQNWHSIYRTGISLTASTVYAFTLFYRAGTSGRMRLTFRNNTTTTETLVNGSVGNLSVTAAFAGAATIISQYLCSDGLTYVVTGTFTPNSTSADHWYRIGPDSTTSGQTVIALGGQLEAGAFPTSYIPTTTATATRSADVASITGTNFSSWYRQDEGTVFAEWIAPPSTGVHWPVPIELNDNTTQNVLRTQYRLPGAKTIRFGSTVAGIASELTTSNTYTPSAIGKTAFGMAASNYGGCLNGGAVATAVTGAMPTVNRAVIGFEPLSGTYFNGTIRRLCYWGQRLPNSTLQTLTQ